MEKPTTQGAKEVDLHSQLHIRFTPLKVLSEHAGTTPGWTTSQFLLRKLGRAALILL